MRIADCGIAGTGARVEGEPNPKSYPLQIAEWRLRTGEQHTALGQSEIRNGARGYFFLCLSLLRRFFLLCFVILVFLPFRPQGIRKCSPMLELINKCRPAERQGRTTSAPPRLSLRLCQRSILSHLLSRRREDAKGCGCAILGSERNPWPLRIGVVDSGVLGSITRPANPKPEIRNRFQPPLFI